ncbi:MAG TPA: hypothetical protein VF614_13890 [Chthoniobacteraceae bacterium]|jgi:hypothetical protein
MKYLSAIATLTILALVAVAAGVQLTPYFGIGGALVGAYFVANAAAQALSITPQLGALNPAAGLKLDKIMRDAMRALKRRLSPVLALSTVFRDVELTETDTVKVPFYSLDTLASKDFAGTYDFTNADAGNSFKDVAVNKRKYQPLEFTSKELRRNSVLDLNRVMGLKVEKLAEDILTDIFSVVTLADYGASILESASSAFDRQDVNTLRTALNQAHWPQAGRALLLESAFEGALVGDLMNVSTSGTDSALREGSVGRVSGFDVFDHPGMPENGERLVGAAMLPYAILCAFSPIEPAEEVRENMSDYRKYVDEDSGLTLEYRSWGNPDSDKARRIVEVNYGYKKGDTAQLKRITRPV